MHALEHEPPTLDPDAVRRSYRVHRARRAARVAHRRRSRMAGARFWIVLLLLSNLLCIALSRLYVGVLF